MNKKLLVSFAIKINVKPAQGWKGIKDSIIFMNEKFNRKKINVIGSNLLFSFFSQAQGWCIL